MNAFGRTVFTVVWLAGGVCGLLASPATTEGGATDFHGDPLPRGAVRRYGTVRFRTGRPIRGLSFSPTGKSIASSDGARVVLWSYPQGKWIWEIKGDLPPGHAFSSDGLLLAVKEIGEKPTTAYGRLQKPCVAVRIVNAANGKVLQTIGPLAKDKEKNKNGEHAMCMAWQPGGTTLAVGWSSGAIDLVDGRTGRKLTRLDAPSRPKRKDQRPPRADLPEKMRRALEERDRQRRLLRPALKISLSADGKSAVALYSHSYETFVVWDIGKRAVRFMSNPMGCSVPALNLSPDGRMLRATFEISDLDKVNIQSCDVSPGTDLKSTFKLYAGHTGKAINENMVFSADGLRMAQSARWSSSKIPWVGYTTVLMADTKSGQTVQLERKLVGDQALAISADGKVLATGGDARAICFWDTATGKPAGGSIQSPGPVFSIAISPDDRLLAMGCSDGKVRIRRITDGKAVAELQGNGGPVEALVFLPDGQTLVGRTPDLASRMPGARLWFWNHRQGSVLANIRMSGGAGPLARTRDGRYVAYTRGATIAVADTVGRAQMKHPFGDYVKEFAPLLGFYVNKPGSSNLATSTGWPSLGEKGLRVQKPSRTPFFCAAFVPGGRQVLGGKGNKLTLVDPVTGKVVRQFAPAADFDVRKTVPWFRHVRATPDGKRTVAIQDTEPYDARFYRTHYGQPISDGIIRMWDTASARELSSFRGHQGPFTAMAFAEGGRALLTAGLDSTVLLWDIEQSQGPAVLPSDSKALASIVVGMDGSLAVQAMRSVCEKPEASMGVVNAWLESGPTDAAVAALIAELGHADLGRRVVAIQKLGALRASKSAILEGMFLRTVLSDETSEPVRYRIHSLLHPHRSRASEPLTELTRLIKLLEWTEDAKAVERLGQWSKRLSVLRGGLEVELALGRIKAGKHRDDLKALPPLREAKPSEDSVQKMKMLTQKVD
jgi:WD40 repeat protein